MARPQQRYVSTELTHFVGNRNPTDDAANYKTLLKILGDRELQPPGLKGAGGAYSVSIDATGSLRRGTMYSPQVVCFCDIPIPDLHIHMAKYGRCGLAFSKRFLTQYGASPVFYVAIDSGRNRPLGDEFEAMATWLRSLGSALLREDVASAMVGLGLDLADARALSAMLNTAYSHSSNASKWVQGKETT